MDKGELLHNTRWDILREVIRGKTNAGEIAKAANTSLPNTSQQLRLLEAHNLIERATEKKQKRGKPRQVYKLKKPFCNLTIGSPTNAEQLFMFTTDFQQLLCNSFLVPSDEQPFLLMGICAHQDLFDTCSIAYVRSTDAIELLLLTDEVEKVRKEYSNLLVQYREKSRKIVAWTHSVDEMKKGIESKDDYFLSLLKHKVLHDPTGRFKEVFP